jgi:hypothetical protein
MKSPNDGAPSYVVVYFILVSFVANNDQRRVKFSEILGSHGGEYEDSCLTVVALGDERPGDGSSNTSETSVNFCHTTPCNNPGDSYLRVNFKLINQSTFVTSFLIDPNIVRITFF